MDTIFFSFFLLAYCTVSCVYLTNFDEDLLVFSVLNNFVNIWILENNWQKTWFGWVLCVQNDLSFNLKQNAIIRDELYRENTKTIEPL